MSHECRPIFIGNCADKDDIGSEDGCFVVNDKLGLTER